MCKPTCSYAFPAGLKTKAETNIYTYISRCIKYLLSRKHNSKTMSNVVNEKIGNEEQYASFERQIYKRYLQQSCWIFDEQF